MGPIKAEWDLDMLVQNNPSVIINTTTQNGINSELEVEMSSESSEVHSETGSSTDTDDYIYDSHPDNRDDERDTSTTSTHSSSTSDSEQVDQDNVQYVDVSVDLGTSIRTEYSAYSYNGNNWINTHRMIMRPGITMRQDFRPWVAWLPRAYPGSCPICLCPNADMCNDPCTWTPVNPTACSRYCDKRIREGYRKYCPMYDIFEQYDHEHNFMPLFPGHSRLRQGVIVRQGNGELMNVVQPYPSGVESNDDSCIIQPFPIDHSTNPEDREMLLDMLPLRRSDDSGNNEGELDHELNDLQSSLNLRAHHYNQYCMRSHTPTTFDHPGNMLLLRVAYREYDEIVDLNDGDDNPTHSAPVAGAEPQSFDDHPIPSPSSA